MPNVPISALPLTTSVCATALVPIVQNGVTCSTYACLLGSGGGGGGVTSIVQGSGICISPACGTGAVTICSIGGGGVMAAGSGTCSIVGSGCNNTASGNYSFVGGGRCNTAINGSSTISGGYCNKTNDSNLFSTDATTIGGGCCNTACGATSTIGGGRQNFICAEGSTISGGICNINCDNYTFIGGGTNNTASGQLSSVVGGFCNTASGYNSFVGGGCCNKACGCRSFVGGGSGNTALCNFTGVFGCNLCNTQPCTFMANNFVVGNFVGCGGCTLALDANGKMCVTSGGGGGIIIAGAGANSTIRCGVNNTAASSFGASLSGCNNTNSGGYAIIAGGACNSTNAAHSFIGGGICNCVNVNFTGQGNCATIGGGLGNYLESAYGTLSGGVFNKVCNSQYFSVIGGGGSNCIIGGGGNSNYYNAIFSGSSNIVSNNANGVPCGCSYQPNLILGGQENKACSDTSMAGGSTVITGAGNIACNEMATVINGLNNCAFGIYSIASGLCNVACGNYSTVIGCCSNDGGLNNSFVFGCGITASGAACTTYLNNLCVYGTIAKGGGFFKIPHPDPIKAEAGKFLKHSFVESPTAGDNIYRFNVTTSNCSASIDLPDYYNLLNGNSHVHVSPDAHFGIAYGKINEENTKVNICSTADGDYFVLLVGTRKDKLALDAWNGTEVDANEEKK